LADDETIEYPFPEDLEGLSDEAKARSGSGISVADLEDDPEIDFNLKPDQNNAKSRFVTWSRASQTEFERKVWKLLGKKENPWMFVPQVEILGFVVDFYSPLHRLALEADGPEHIQTAHKDRDRDKVLLIKKGIKTLRLTMDNVDFGSPQTLFRLIEHWASNETVITPEMVDGD